MKLVIFVDDFFLSCIMWMCIFIDRVYVYKKHLLGKFSGDFHIHAYDNASFFYH